MTWPPLYGNGVYNATSGLVPPISQGLKILKLTRSQELSETQQNGPCHSRFLMQYWNDGAHLTLTCLPRDLILRSLNMSRGDLALGHM